MYHPTPFSAGATRQFFQRLVESGGPEAADYPALNHQMTQLHGESEAGRLDPDLARELINILQPTLSLDTMQGFSFCKPHGYAGDFEIIDRIYNEWVSPNPRLQPWDRYFHAQAAPRAVRNRKDYFHKLLHEIDTNEAVGKRVLKLGLGPGRSMYEWFCARPNSRLHFECVELDQKAIQYARKLNKQHVHKITFVHGNAVRHRPSHQFDLIWAAGLFDYFSDRAFVSIVRRMWSSVTHGGRLVIGNFGAANSSRPYMELVGEWRLIHRSAEQLLQLAHDAGIPRENMHVDAEPEGVNLFLQAKK
jgi:SAM-dependent methyltransferase